MASSKIDYVKRIIDQGYSESFLIWLREMKLAGYYKKIFSLNRCAKYYCDKKHVKPLVSEMDPEAIDKLVKIAKTPWIDEMK